MKKTLFNRDWLFYKDGCKADAQTVQLPHDAMLYEKRSPENTAGLGYFPGGKYYYEKAFSWSHEYDGKTLILEFEGVYRHTTVFVNGKKAAYWAYGYTQFYVDLTPYLNPGQENTVLVEADNSLQPNSRWYSGSGIYRNVSLWIGGSTYLHPESVRITTKSHAPAVIEVAVDTGPKLAVRTDILYHGNLIATAEGQKTEIGIPDAHFWDDGHPELYTAHITLSDSDGNVLDEAEEAFGIRTIAWNAREGLLINGNTKKLRGACIHHDNGVLGACAFPDAEARKVRILKEAGFNAIRSAHNPCSKSLLEACDRYGVYVMDEAFDSWYIAKNSQDYAINFDAWHQKDLSAMVKKDYNHPSVIAYSIGNEVIETAQEQGIALAGEMRGLIHSLDTTRPVTCGISITQNIDEYKSMESAKEQYMGGIEKKEKPQKRQTQAAPGLQVTAEMMSGINMFMAKLGMDNEAKAATQDAEDALHGVCRYLDIPGYNYGEEKYRYDTVHCPDRVVVHSETHHTQLFEHWALVEANPHITGDFMWVGWDHLGEAGIGALGYPSRGGIGFDKPYPYLTSGSGIIDITGFRHPESYWAQMVWHLRQEPVIAVEPVERSGEPYMMSYWNDTEGVSSWSWAGLAGKEATVKVYTPEAEAELILNGTVIARRPVEKNMAVFTVPYEAGRLQARVFNAQGQLTGTAELATAQPEEVITATVDKAILRANGQDLAFIDIALTDAAGIVHVYPDTVLTVTVSGAGSLQGLGSGAVFTEDSFVSGTCHSFYGRGLAVIRAGYQAGDIVVKITGGNASKELTLSCKDAL